MWGYTFGMKIMTYNILEGGIDDKGSRIEHIIKVIKEENPDFLALQEANNFDKNDSKLLKRVSKETKLPHYGLSQGGLYDDGNRYHTSSLSRYPFREVYTFPESSFQCSAISVVIDSPFGELSICNIHLNARSEDERLKELEVVLNHQSKHEKNIILGDHNTLSRVDNYGDISAKEFTHYGLTRFDVTDTLHKSYVDTLAHLNIKDRSTHPTAGVCHPISENPIRIDYVFVTLPLSPNIKSGKVIKTKISNIASDHYPTVVTLN